MAEQGFAEIGTFVLLPQTALAEQIERVQCATILIFGISQPSTSQNYSPVQSVQAPVAD